MGKAKRQGGLAGVARFVFESMKSDTTNSKPQNASSTLTQEITPIQINQGDQMTEEDHREGTSNINRPTKKRKTNKGSSVAVTTEFAEKTSVQGWIQKYDASGLVPHYADASQVPEHLQKYFSQRERFFSLYSTPPGCLLDEEGWYSVTPELVADQIAERCRCDTILDAFCGVGGNAIAFAKTCQRVIALDTSLTRLTLARHNAQIYGVADRIEFVLADYRSFAKSYLSLRSSSDLSNPNLSHTRKIDVVFLSPPWGGPTYLDGSLDDNTHNKKEKRKSSASVHIQAQPHPSYSLSSIRPIHGADLFGLTRQITKNVAYYLPRNTRLEEISNLLVHERNKVNDSLVEENVEVEEEWTGNKLKALTCYFGGLVSGQEAMF